MHMHVSVTLFQSPVSKLAKFVVHLLYKQRECVLTTGVYKLVHNTFPVSMLNLSGPSEPSAVFLKSTTGAREVCFLEG